MRGLAFALFLWLCACGSVVRPGSQPTPSAAPLSRPELQYRLIDTVGAPAYCDPMLYPVARTLDPADAASMVAALHARDPAEFDAIVRHEHLNAASLSPADDLRILSQASELAAVPLTSQGARYGFAYEVVGPPAAEVAGTIDASGAIALASRTPAPRRPCPICLAWWTLIATPAGELPVTEVRAGMQVWTQDAAGRRVPAPVLAVGHTVAPAGHRVVHLVLADGRSVDSSPGHRLPDGRPVGDLRPGEPLDGSVVVSVERQPYRGATWDLLPAGPTHLYWADGVLLGSTLA